MKKLLLLMAIGSVLVMNSCNTIVYTSASTIQPVTQSPSSVKEKGDIQIYGGYESYNSRDPRYYNPYVQIKYVNLHKHAVNASITGAVSDKFALGLQFEFDKKFEATGQGLTMTFTRFGNYDRKKNRKIGFDVTTGFSWDMGQNFMSVDSVFFEMFVYDGEEYEVFFDFSLSHLGYYMIDKMDMKAYVQPSFTFENKKFEFHIGGSIGYHYRHRYDPGFFYDQSSVAELEYYNPMAYYGQKKHFIFGEYFISMGLGNENVRLIGMFGAGRRNDRVQPSYGFGQLGVRGRF